MQLKELFDVLLEVADDDSKLRGGKHHGGKAREEDGDSIQPLNSQAGSRVCPVSFCKTGIEQSKDCAPVCRESCHDVGSVAMDTADNNNMFT